jgi:MFS family permease
VRKTGRALLIAIFIFGVATIAFGVSQYFIISLLMYAVTGMADQVSVIMRQTTVQLATPDELRGRVGSVSMIFINASNQVGAAESGLIAALTSAVFSVVSGGVACLAVAGAVTALAPELRHYDIDTSPHEVQRRAAEEAAARDTATAEAG